MMRWAAALLLWIACDAGVRTEQPHKATPRDDTYKGNAKQIEQMMKLAVAAWNEDGSEMPTATDVREDLYVLDGDEAFFLSGHPIAANDKTGRPAAVKAVDAVFRAAR